MHEWEEKSCFLSWVDSQGLDPFPREAAAPVGSALCLRADGWQEGDSGVGLQADLGRNWVSSVIWTWSTHDILQDKAPWLLVGRRCSVGCFPPCWKEQSDLTNPSLCPSVLYQGGEDWENRKKESLL